VTLNEFLFARHLEDDEHIVTVVHKHWLMGVRSLFWPVVSFWFAAMALALFPGRFLFLAAAIWACASLVWLARNFFDYYLDAWIITSMGIIDLEWHGWFHRESARILYSDVHGVSYEIQGILATLLRYGTVAIEKISTGALVSIAYVPNPRVVEATILRNMETYLHSKNLKDAKHVQELLAEFVSTEVQRQTLPKKRAAKA
jgi:hypothetical protein